MTTPPKVTPENRTLWQRLTTDEKREQVRQAVQVEGLTYTQAAQQLGATSREAIAGVVERAKKSGNPIVTSSGMKYGGNYRGATRWPKGAKAAAAPKARPKAKPKLKHAGVHRFVALPAPVIPVDIAPVRGDVWLALPGSNPVAIEGHRENFCRWPVGLDKPFLYCDLAVKDGSVYCESHSALAYRPVPPRARP